MKLFTLLICTLGLGLATPVLAGGPTASHPCYAVADREVAAQPREPPAAGQKAPASTSR